MTTDSAARGHTTHTSHHGQRPHARRGLRFVAATITAVTFAVPVAAPAGAGGGLLGGLLGTLEKVLNAVPATLNGVLAFGASPLDEFANQPSTPLQPGQVTDLIGQPTDQGAYVTGKAWIPFYFGGDQYRHELAYKGMGRLVFAGGGMNNLGSGKLIRIIHNANDTGYR